MNKFKLILITLIVFSLATLLPSPSSAAINPESLTPVSTLIIDLEIKFSDMSISVKSIKIFPVGFVAQSSKINLDNPNLLTVKLIDTRSNQVSKVQFNPLAPDLLADAEGPPPESTVQSVSLTYRGNARKLVIYREEKEILSYDLASFCKQNNYCQPEELTEEDLAKTLSAVYGKEVKLNPQTQTKNQQSVNNLIQYLALAIGGLILLTIMILAGIYFWRLRKKPPSTPPPPISPTPPSQPNYADTSKVTNYKKENSRANNGQSSTVDNLTADW